MTPVESRLQLWPGHALPNIRARAQVDVGALLRGREPAAAAQLLPALFALCGSSHRLAAELAIAAARGEPRAADPQQRARLQRETLAEHLRRVWLDWPRHLIPTDSNEPGRSGPTNAAITTLAAGLACLDQPQALQAWLAEFLIGGDPVIWLQHWQRRDDAALAHWRGQRATLPAQWLDAVAVPAAWLARASVAPLPEPALVRSKPAVHETGSWTREPGPVPRHALDRLQARIAEILRLSGVAGSVPVLRSGALAGDGGVGVGWCDMARGRLVHRVRLQGAGVAARILDYRVHAPTDINFSGFGAVAQAIAAVEPGRDAAWHCAIIACAFDPCVAFDVVAEGAPDMEIPDA